MALVTVVPPGETWAGADEANVEGSPGRITRRHARSARTSEQHGLGQRAGKTVGATFPMLMLPVRASERVSPRRRPWMSGLGAMPNDTPTPTTKVGSRILTMTAVLERDTRRRRHGARSALTSRLRGNIWHGNCPVVANPNVAARKAAICDTHNAALRPPYGSGGADDFAYVRSVSARGGPTLWLATGIQRSTPVNASKCRLIDESAPTGGFVRGLKCRRSQDGERWTSEQAQHGPRARLRAWSASNAGDPG
jgi:hypothetical protein